MCWASNHQNTYRNYPRAHFPFNLPLFGDSCQHIKKQPKEVQHQCNWRLNYFCLWFGIFGSLFATTWFVFANQNLFPIFESNTLVWAIREIFQEKNLSSAKNSPFSHNQNLPHKRPNFAIRVFRTNHKFLLYYFQNSQVVGWSSCLGLNFSPFGIKHQNRIIFCPLTPLPHQKCQLRAKRQWEHKDELGIKYTNTGVQWKS
jgi:hypothetical protein